MASFGDVAVQSGLKLPALTTIQSVLIYVGIGIVIAIILVFGGIWWWQRRKFSKTIRMFKKVGNRSIPIGTDKAMFERVGLAGDYWAKTQKFGKYLAKPQIEMSKDEFWYYIREDGEWINFGLDDIDQQMKDAGVYFLDEDMRLTRLAIEKNLMQRYDKKSFWDKYGVMIMYGLAFLIIAILLIVLFQRLTPLAGAISGSVGKLSESCDKAMDTCNNIISHVYSGLVNPTAGNATL